MHKSPAINVDHVQDGSEGMNQLKKSKKKLPDGGNFLCGILDFFKESLEILEMLEREGRQTVVGAGQKHHGGEITKGEFV